MYSYTEDDVMFLINILKLFLRVSHLMRYDMAILTLQDGFVGLS